MGIKMKKKIKIGIIASAVIIGFISYMTITKKSKENKEKYSIELIKLISKEKDYDKLIKVIYSNSGDMNGNIDRITLDIKNNLLIHEYKSIHSNPLKKEEYKVSENNILDIEKYIEKYNFPMWKDLERREEFALDAPTTGMLFIFDNRKISNNPYEEYYIDYEYQIPQDGREALYQLEEKLKSLKGQNNKEKNR